MDHISELARISRSPEEALRDFEARMSAATGRSGVLEKVHSEGEARVKRVLKDLNQPAFTKDTQHLLLSEALKHDAQLKTVVAKLDGATELDKAAALARRIARVGKGFFLKKDFAEGILRKRPPEHLLSFLGYSTVDELLSNHDVTEAFSALRFMESDEWMHETFDKAYSSFTIDDFEERDIELKVLGSEWHDVALKFVEKKRHNVSHLKEFGVIFLNPIAEDMPGKFLRDFALLFHYFHEIEFYSKLFRRFAEGPAFAERFKALLRGDVREASEIKPGEWLIVQRYFAKLNPQDARLFIPRVNPESLHWRRGEMDLVEFAQTVPSLEAEFWKDLDWVGTMVGEEVVSLDMEDNAMAAVFENEGKPQFFNYHQQEAFWLKVFTEYWGGESELEEKLLNHFAEGIIR